MNERDLTLRYKVEEKTGDLLAMAVKAAQDAGGSDLKPGQVKALLRQVQTGNGVEHVCNWLRYQSARVSTWETSGLADAVLTDVAALRTEAETLTKALYPGQFEEQLGLVWLALVQRYVGYLNRKFVALKKDESDEE
jgi:hypothetical protein